MNCVRLGLLSTSSIPAAVLIASTIGAAPAMAACIQSGTTVNCTVDDPNPHGSIVGSGSSSTITTVTVGDGAEINVKNTDAISLGNNVNITIKDGGTVRNSADSGSTGKWGVGANTVEFGSNGTLIVEKGGQIIKTGNSNNAEAVNVLGYGNTIINHGLIQASGSAALWFEDKTTGAKNVVDNYGTIERVGGGSVFGTSGSSGIVFRNRSDAQVIGDLIFAKGNDELYFYANSLVTGSIDGGLGTNSLTLEGADGSNDELKGAIKNFTTLTKEGEGKWTVSGSLSGFTSVTVNDGTLALTGNNTDYTGSVLVNSDGVLEARAQSLPVKTAAAQNVNNVTNNGLVRFVQTDNGTYVGQIVGTGTVEKTGDGVLTLDPYATDGNTYSGGTAINGGTIAVSADNALGAATGGLSFNGGTLRFDAAFNLAETRAITLDELGGTIDTNGFATQISQAISGKGGLTKTGDGTLTLEGDNTYEGETLVNAGALYVNGDQSAAKGDTTVANGGTIGGTGILGGNLAIANGGTLSPGAEGTTPGTLTVNGNLALAGGANLDYRFGQANVEGGALNDLTVVKGDLVLDGTINVTTTQGGSFDPGIYRVISYSGTLTNNGLEIGTIPSDQFYVQTSVDKQVNLVNTAGLNLTIWDGAAGPKNDGTIQGGDGLWQNATGNDNWTNIEGTVNAPWEDAAFAVFTGAPGTVTVDNSLGDVTASGMQFAVDGYVIKGDVLTLVGDKAIIRVGDGTTEGADYTAKIDSVLAGESTLVKTDLGTLVLTGANTYTGGTEINGGTLAVAADNALGATDGDLSFDGGTLRFDAAFDLAETRTITLNAGGGTFNTNGFDTKVAQGMTGEGGLTKTGKGTLTLAGTSDYAGNTLVAQGTLAAGAENAFSAASIHGVAEGATLDLGGYDQTIAGLENAGLVTMGTKPGTTLTLTGDYLGQKGTVAINTALGDDTSTTDRLVVQGNSTGTSTLQVTNVGGTGAATVEGIKVVDVTGSSDGTFTLKGDYTFNGSEAVIGGAYAYRLYKNGVSTPDDGDWYLRSSLTDPEPTPEPGEPGEPNEPGEPENPTPEPNPEPTPEPSPLYQPGVPLYEAYGQTLQALNQLSTLQQRVGNRQWAQGTSASQIESANGVWGRITGTRARPDAAVSTSSTDIDIDSWKMQLGVDFALRDSDDGSALIAGLNGYYGKATGDVASLFGDGRIKTDGYGLGATLTWYSADGFYADAQAQLSWFSTDLQSDILGTLIEDNDGQGQAFSLELGKRMAIGNGLSLTPQVQTAYSHVDFDGFVDPYGAQVGLDKGTSLKTRLGVSLDHQAHSERGSHHVYGVANLVYEWMDGTRADVSGTAFNHRDDRLWGELGLGGSYSWNNRTTLYLEATGSTAMKDFGSSTSITGTAGLRVAF